MAALDRSRSSATALDRLDKVLAKSTAAGEDLRRVFLERYGIDVRRVKRLPPLAEIRASVRRAVAEQQELQRRAAALARAEDHGGLLRLADVLKLTGLSRATIYRLERAGTFPKRVKLTATAAGWSERAVRDWIAAKLRG